MILAHSHLDLAIEEKSEVKERPADDLGDLAKNTIFLNRNNMATLHNEGPYHLLPKDFLSKFEWSRVFLEGEGVVRLGESPNALEDDFSNNVKIVNDHENAERRVVDASKNVSLAVHVRLN